MYKEYIIILLSILFLITVPIWWSMIFNWMLKDSAKSFHKYMENEGRFI